MSGLIRVENIVTGPYYENEAAKTGTRVVLRNTDGDVFHVRLTDDGELEVRVAEGTVRVSPDASNTVRLEAVGWRE